MAIVASVAAAQEPLRFETRHVEEKIAGCGDARKGCAHAELTYVEAVSGPAGVRERINAGIRKFIVSPQGDGVKPTDAPEEFAKDFLRDWKKEEKESRQWLLERSMKVLRAMPPVVSLECDSSEYEGGAHPTGATTFLNFDAATGEVVKLPFILRDGAVPRLTAIAEAHFRKQRQLAPDADLKEAGFSFHDNKFQLNGNFGLTDKVLVFEYIRYEIAPGSMGATRIEIPLAEIRDLLK
jgi:hypothetical protein